MPDFKFSMPDFSGSPLLFIKEARAELKKVIWPGKNQVINLTILVILVTIGLAALLGSLDYAFTKILAIVIK